jgi:hypothetical protein
MTLFLKVSLPVLVVANLFDGVYDRTSVIIDFIAIAAIVGSMLVYSRTKAALAVAESATKSWHEEAEAQRDRADRTAYDMKLEIEAKLKLLAQVASLEARPDLTRLESLVAEATEATKNHEVSAGARTERLIAAIEKLTPAV